MIVLSITLTILGLVFMVCGYTIRFKHKYNIINYFEEEKQKGMLDDNYAKGLGNITFYGGIIMTFMGGASFFMNMWSTMITFFVGVFGLCAIMVIHRIVSIKRP